MKASLVKIGNSRGIRLPKPIIEQCGFGDEVEIEVHNQALIVRSSTAPRADWDIAFSKMSKEGDDELLDKAAEPGSSWDDEEWEW